MTGPLNVLVGGGTGFIGSVLCNALKTKGYGVTVISRMPGPQRISWNELLSKGLPKDTTAVVNLAGQNVMDISRRWTHGFKQNVYNSRINTTKSLAKLIDEASVKPSVFVTMSGVGAYKPDTSKEYDENSCIVEFDFFSKLCKDWERAAALKLESQSSCRIVTIRSGVVLGRTGGMIRQLYLPFYLGLGGPVGDGSQYMPWIHIDDLISLIIFAIQKPTVEGVLNGVAPYPCTNKDFSNAFGKALHRPAFIPLPSFVLNLLLNKERAVMMTEGQKVLPKKTIAAGFKYQYPDIERACKEIVSH
ncbi:epimerase family protein SDR39U1 [Leptinotarsa decemlineata]|uniref:epimerase family protein SDR39U1 n=1 Tax=Leptinotarsa decemlineata TaxID=7539 RepID=UPI003D30761A